MYSCYLTLLWQTKYKIKLHPRSWSVKALPKASSAPKVQGKITWRVDLYNNLFGFCLFCLQSCIGILVALILTFFLLKRQGAKLWRQLISALTVIPNTCREVLSNTGGRRVRGLLGRRKNRVDPLAGQVQLETIHQLGKVLKKEYSRVE